MSLYYQKILWYRNEARQKEKRNETFLNWTHQSHYAPWILWFGSLICYIIYLVLYLDLDFFNGD
jgi:hypothetical protein